MLNSFYYKKYMLNRLEVKSLYQLIYKLNNLAVNSLYQYTCMLNVTISHKYRQALA